MDRHKEDIRILPDAKTAVLFIHGIVGTPDQFRNFIPFVPENWSIYNVLLDGHGKDVDDFAKSSMNRWKEQIGNILNQLRKSHENIVIVAHSMGTLFAIRSSVENPEKIHSLFLMASPLRIAPKPIALVTSLKVLFGKISPDDERTKGAERSYGIRPDKRLWKYISWIPRYIELLREVRYTKKILSELTVPCSVYQSGKDELVSYSSVRIFAKNPQIFAETLPESGHFHLSGKDEKYLLSSFQNLCNKIEKHF